MLHVLCELLWISIYGKLCLYGWVGGQKCSDCSFEEEQLNELSLSRPQVAHRTHLANRPKCCYGRHLSVNQIFQHQSAFRLPLSNIHSTWVYQREKTHFTHLLFLNQNGAAAGVKSPATLQWPPTCPGPKSRLCTQRVCVHARLVLEGYWKHSLLTAGTKSRGWVTGKSEVTIRACTFSCSSRNLQRWSGRRQAAKHPQATSTRHPAEGKYES